MDKLPIFKIPSYAGDIRYHSMECFTVKDLCGQGYINVTSDRDLLSLCRTLKGGDRLDVYIEHNISSPNSGGNYLTIEYYSVSSQVLVVAVKSNTIESGIGYYGK